MLGACSRSKRRVHHHINTICWSLDAIPDSGIFAAGLKVGGKVPPVETEMTLLSEPCLKRHRPPTAQGLERGRPSRLVARPSRRMATNRKRCLHGLGLCDWSCEGCPVETEEDIARSSYAESPE
jgi:hypothetical protein